MTPASFRVLSWPTDPTGTIDATGLYAETYWLPILCPTAYVLGRRLAILSNRARVAEGELLILETETLAAALGIFYGDNLDLYRRAMKRLGRYRLVHWRGSVNLEVRTRWPRLNGGLLATLPEAMQQVEPEWWALEGGSTVPEFIER